MNLIVPVDGAARYDFEECLKDNDVCFEGHLNLTDTDPITFTTFFENFKGAQSRGQPYYVLNLIELREGDNQVRFKWYDAMAWRSYMSGKRGENPILCPTTRLEVIRTHVFAMECFDFDENKNNQPLDTPKLVKPFFPELYFEEKDPNLALDALNYMADMKKNRTALKVELIVRELTRSIDECRAYIKCLQKTTTSPRFSATPTLKSTTDQSINIFNRSIQSLNTERSKWMNYNDFIAGSKVLDQNSSDSELDELRSSVEHIKHSIEACTVTITPATVTIKPTNILNQNLRSSS